jgi:hypothetical protein
MMLSLVSSALLASAFEVPASIETLQPEPTPWTWSITGYTVNPPDDDSYVSTIVRADRGALHLEGRYQYEALDTGSLWIGRNFEFTDEVTMLVTPMIGAVFGDVDGAALGVEADATWKRVSFYIESEYLFDFADPDDNYLFSWSELSFTAPEWLRYGLVGQRTRVFDQELSVDRGFLLGVELERISATFYWFNPDRDDPYAAFTLGVSL